LRERFGYRLRIKSETVGVDETETKGGQFMTYLGSTYVKELKSAQNRSVKAVNTTAVLGYLQALVSTGLYGRHHTEAAERLISQGIERLIHQGTLKISTTENQFRSSKRVEND
jgi:hypothetical protein